MAVYERRFHRYTGPTTPRRWRFLVVARYASREVFRSRIATVRATRAMATAVARSPTR